MSATSTSERTGIGAPVEAIDTLVAGAGPAGLAVAACLRRAGVPFIAVERADAVGSAWRNHYDRLHLHTSKRHSGLPYLEFPAEIGTYPARAEVVAYLESYARAFGIDPRFGEEVLSARRTARGWETRTSRGAYVSERLVVATGYNRVPNVPRWLGDTSFRGTLIHSAKYRNGGPFRGKRVLVVGIGNTGGEIALDLVEHGAAEVAISVRGPVNVIPRDVFGRPTQETGILLARFPVWVRDVVGRAVSRMAFGDLTPYGLAPPPYGPATQIGRFAKIPLIDIGTVAAIKRGAIQVVGDVERFTERGVVLRDGSAREFDAVILATGFRPGLSFLEGAEGALDERGYPRSIEAGPALPGLYFVGYANVSTGLLRQIAIDAKAVAARIAKRRAAEGKR